MVPVLSDIKENSPMPTTDDASLVPADRLCLCASQLHYSSPTARLAGLSLASMARPLDWTGRRGWVVATVPAIRLRMGVWTDLATLDTLAVELALMALREAGYIAYWTVDTMDGMAYERIEIDTAALAFRINDDDAADVRRREAA